MRLILTKPDTTERTAGGHKSDKKQTMTDIPTHDCKQKALNLNSVCTLPVRYSIRQKGDPSWRVYPTVPRTSVAKQRGEGTRRATI